MQTGLSSGIGRVGLTLALIIGMFAVFIGAGLSRVAAQDDPESEGAAASIRFVHASPGAPEIDVIVDGEIVVEALPFGEASDYASAPGGERQVQIVPTGQSSDEAVIDETLEFDSGQASIVAVVGALNEIEMEAYEVNLDATEAGQARVRVIHASPDAGEVDIAVAGGDTLFDGVEFKDATDYEDLDAGTVDLEVRQDDTVVLTAPGVVLEAGTVYDVMAIGQASDDSLMLLPLATSVSAPCSTLLDVGMPDDACVRIVHASPDAPAVDVYVNDTVVVEGLASGEATEFAALPAGEDVQIAVTSAGGSVDDAVIEAETDLDAGQAYQVIAVGELDDGLNALINEIDLTPLPADQARVRAVHASPDADSVSVTEVDGANLFEDVGFEDATNYAVVDAGEYDLGITRDDEFLVRADDVQFEAGSAYDLIVTGLAEDNSLQILVLTANATPREGEVATLAPATPSPSVPLATPDVVGTPAA